MMYRVVHDTQWGLPPVGLSENEGRLAMMQMGGLAKHDRHALTRFFDTKAQGDPCHPVIKLFGISVRGKPRVRTCRASMLVT